MATPTPTGPTNPNPAKKPGEGVASSAKPPASGTVKPGTPPVGKLVSSGPPVSKPASPATKAAVPPGKPAAQPAKPAAQPAKPAAGSKAPLKPSAVTGAPKPAPAAKAPAPAPKKQISSGNRKFGQVLVDLGFIDEAQMEQLFEDARTKDITVEKAAIDSGLINEDQLLQATAEQLAMRVVNLDEVKPQPTAIGMVQQQMAELYKMLPLSFENDVLTVVMADPNNLQALDDIRNFLGIQQVQAVLAPPKKIDEAIAKTYSATKEESIADLIANLESDTTMGSNRRETSIDLQGLEEMAHAAPVRKLINMVLLMAIRDHASDIHFEPFEDEYKMRYRCDGILSVDDHSRPLTLQRGRPW